MVKTVKGLFVCEQCGYRYKERSWAEKCEAYCKKHHACSLRIAKHAIR